MEEVKDVDYILDTFVGGGHWWQWKITLVRQHYKFFLFFQKIRAAKFEL